MDRYSTKLCLGKGEPILAAINKLIGLFFFFTSLATIAAYARRRGKRPLIWALVASAGYFRLSFYARRLWQRHLAAGEWDLLVRLAPWFWLGLVALYLRLVVARKMVQSTMPWICSNCTYTNGRHAVFCEACRQSYCASEAARGLK